MSTEAWLDHLRNNGYRRTAARQAVVETIAQARRALTPLEVYHLARKRYPALGLVTVYRTLEKLEELNLIQRVHQEGGCQAFLRAGQGHQHILICERCKRAVLFEGDDLQALFDHISQQTGFEIRHHWLQASGLCADCR